jgi:predicted outer membrane protein
VTNKKLEEMHKTKKTEIDELVKRHKAELEKLNKEHNENLGQLRDENTYVSDELTTCQSLLNALQEGNTSSRVNNSEPQRLRKRPASVMEKE